MYVAGLSTAAASLLIELRFRSERRRKDGKGTILLLNTARQRELRARGEVAIDPDSLLSSCCQTDFHGTDWLWIQRFDNSICDSVAPCVVVRHESGYSLMVLSSTSILHISLWCCDAVRTCTNTWMDFAQKDFGAWQQVREGNKLFTSWGWFPTWASFKCIS